MCRSNGDRFAAALAFSTDHARMLPRCAGCAAEGVGDLTAETPETKFAKLRRLFWGNRNGRFAQLSIKALCAAA